eukprot:gene17948-biopygen23389
MQRRRRCHELAILKDPEQSRCPAARSMGGLHCCQLDPAPATHEDLADCSPLSCLGWCWQPPPGTHEKLTDGSPLPCPDWYWQPPSTCRSRK